MHVPRVEARLVGGAIVFAVLLTAGALVTSVGAHTTDTTGAQQVEIDGEELASATAEVTEEASSTDSVAEVTFEFDAPERSLVVLRAGDTRRVTLADEGVNERNVKLQRGLFRRGEEYPVDVEVSVLYGFVRGGTCTAEIERDDGAIDVCPVESEGAAFQIGTLVTDRSAVAGADDVVVEATVENVHDREGTQTIDLDAGELGSDSAELTLDGGESETVSLSIGTEESDTGSYTATVSTEDDSATVDVTIEEPDDDVDVPDDDAVDEPDDDDDVEEPSIDEEAVDRANELVDAVNSGNGDESSIRELNARLTNVEPIEQVDSVAADAPADAEAEAERLREEADRLEAAITDKVPREINSQAPIELVDPDGIETATDLRDAAAEVPNEKARDFLLDAADAIDSSEERLGEAAGVLENGDEGEEPPLDDEVVDRANELVDAVNSGSGGDPSIEEVNARLTNVESIEPVDPVEAETLAEAEAEADRLREEIDRLEAAITDKVPREINSQAPIELVDPDGIETATDLRDAAAEVPNEKARDFLLDAADAIDSSEERLGEAARELEAVQG